MRIAWDSYSYEALKKAIQNGQLIGFMIKSLMDMHMEESQLSVYKDHF